MESTYISPEMQSYMADIFRGARNIAKVVGRMLSKAALFVPRIYLQGLKSFIPVTRRALRREKVAVTVVAPVPVPTTRPPRNYDKAALARAKAIMPTHYIELLKSLGGTGGNDEIVLHYLRTIPVALASQDFEAVYDGMLEDERLSDDEKDLIASATLDCQSAELALL